MANGGNGRIHVFLSQSAGVPAAPSASLNPPTNTSNFGSAVAYSF